MESAVSALTVKTRTMIMRKMMVMETMMMVMGLKVKPRPRLLPAEWTDGIFLSDGGGCQVSLSVLDDGVGQIFISYGVKSGMGEEPRG